MYIPQDYEGFYQHILMYCGYELEDYAILLMN